MPRPCKRRRVCAMPGCKRFGPQSQIASKSIPPAVVMAVDEFETIRLIDHLGMTQEQCAMRMNVARTTAQAIYANARAKLADCLVNEKELRIEGGDYVLCDGGAQCCSCGCCCHNNNPKQSNTLDAN